MGIPDMLKPKRSLEELEQEDEAKQIELSIAEKKSLISQAEQRYGKGGWKLFSSNGFMSGIDWQAIKFRP